MLNILTGAITTTTTVSIPLGPWFFVAVWSLVFFILGFWVFWQAHRKHQEILKEAEEIKRLGMEFRKLKR